jgi:hypothetical protein
MQTNVGSAFGRSGIAHMEWVDTYILGVAMVLRTDGGRDAWGRLRVFFDQDFADALDKEIDADNTTFLQVLLD